MAMPCHTRHPCSLLDFSPSIRFAAFSSLLYWSPLELALITRASMDSISLLDSDLTDPTLKVSLPEQLRGTM
jgi:hypothetical protein